MGAKEIITREFEMVLRGYKTEDVKEFQREISIEFSRLQKENEDLEKKLEVLADKIREYREDEDTLKDALLGAQRQGNALIADSKRKAAEIIEDAQATSENIAQKAEEDRLKKKKQGEDEIAAAEEKAAEIIANANEAAADIEREMNLKTDIQKEILHRTSDEVAKYKSKILEHYKRELEVVKAHYDEHTKLVDSIAKDCENEFIRDTLKSPRPTFDDFNNESDDDGGGSANRGGGSGVTGGSGVVSGNSAANRGKNRGKAKNTAQSNAARHQKFETAEVTVTSVPKDDVDLDRTIKFEIDVDGNPVDYSPNYSDDYSEESVAQEIFGNSGADDTGDIPFFSATDSQVKQQTNEIFFKKEKIVQ